MYITKQIQNQSFKKNRSVHTSFLFKQTVSHSKLDTNRFTLKPFFTSLAKTSSQNTMRVKSAYYKKIQQHKRQTKSMRPTTCNTHQSRQKMSRSITSMSEQKLKKIQAQVNKNNHEFFEFQPKNLEQSLSIDKLEKRKIQKKLDQIVSIAKKGNIIKRQCQKQNFDQSNFQNLFVNDKLKELYLTNKLSKKAYQYVRGFNCLQKRGRNNKNTKKIVQQVSIYGSKTQVHIQNQNAKQLQKFCSGGYTNSYQDLTKYLTINKFNQSRQKFGTLQQYYNKAKNRYKIIKNQKVNENTNDMQPLQKQLVPGSIMSVVHINQFGQRMNEVKSKKFYKINNFL